MSEQAKHTPEPWKFSEEDGGTYSWLDGPARGEVDMVIEVVACGTLAKPWYAMEIKPADKRLIEDAPKTAAERDRLKTSNEGLLNACEDIRDTKLKYPMSKRELEILNKLLNAIAKAKGE